MTTQKSYTLYTHPYSANGRKALAVSYHLHLEPEIKLINVYQGEGQTSEYLAINPFGQIPTLIDGEFILLESNAILQYISEQFGHFKLSSKDPQKRADITRWLFWESAHFQPAVSTVLAPSVGHHLLPLYFPAPSQDPQWKHPEFERCLSYLNSHLSRQRFLVDDELTIADFGVAGMMTYFRFAKFPFVDFPSVQKWYERIEALDAWRKSKAEIWG